LLEWAATGMITGQFRPRKSATSEESDIRQDPSAIP
jgi:hypothetical protein